MAKKKRAAKRAKTTRKSTTRRKATRARAAAAPAQKLKLKDLRPLVQRSVSSLETVAAGEPGRYSEARARLQRWMDDMDWLCDLQNPEGCGPDMVFPRPS